MSDTTKTWFFHDGNAKAGPFTLDELQEKFSRGEILMTHFLWREGMDAWKRVSEVGVLKPVMAVAQPPVLEIDSISRPAPMAAPMPSAPRFGNGGGQAAVAMAMPAQEYSPAAHVVPAPAAVAQHEATPAYGTQKHEDGLSVLIELPTKHVAENTGQLDVGQLRNARKEAAKATKIAKDTEKFSPNRAIASAVAVEQGANRLKKLAFGGVILFIGFAAIYFLMPDKYSAQGTGILDRLFSPIPTLQDVSPEEYVALTGAAKARIETGGKAEVALSTTGRDQPVFYVATNLPTGTPLTMMLEPVASTLTGDAPPTLQISISVMDKLGKTTPIVGKNGTIPVGEYRAQLMDQDKHVLATRQYFLGGAKDDATYQAKLAQYQTARKAAAGTELNDLNAVATRLEAQLTSDRQSGGQIGTIPNPALRAKAWAQYDQQWMAADSDIEKLLRTESRYLRQTKLAAQAFHDAVHKVHDSFRAQLSGASASANAPTGDVSAPADARLTELKTRLDAASKNVNQTGGYVKEEL